MKVARRAGREELEGIFPIWEWRPYRLTPSDDYLAMYFSVCNVTQNSDIFRLQYNQYQIHLFITRLPNSGIIPARDWGYSQYQTHHLSIYYTVLQSTTSGERQHIFTGTRRAHLLQQRPDSLCLSPPSPSLRQPSTPQGRHGLRVFPTAIE